MYAKMIDEELTFSKTQIDRSWLPVVEGDILTHDEKTHVAGVSGYDVQETQVVKVWRIERRPNKEVALDRLADRVAERLLSQL